MATSTATTTLSGIVREIMVTKKARSEDYKIYLKWAADAVSKYRTTYEVYSEKIKIELDKKGTFSLPCNADGIVRISVPYQGRMEDLWELTDMVNTTTMVNGEVKRLELNGENERIGLDSDEPYNPFGYYSLSENREVFIVTDKDYDYVILEYETTGVTGGESLVPKRYKTMIERYVTWNYEMTYGSNKSVIPYYQKLYEDEAVMLRNANVRLTIEEVGKSFITDTFDRL